MNKSLHRALALTILLLMSVTLGGISAKASLLVETGQPAACCDHAGETETEQQDSCPLDDCSCCTGAPLLHSKYTDLCHDTANLTLPIDLANKLKPSACYHAIEYPPELS